MTECRSTGGVFRPKVASVQRARLTDWPRAIGIARYHHPTLTPLNVDTEDPSVISSFVYTRFASGAVGRSLGPLRPGGRHMTCNALWCARAVSRLALFSVLVNVFGWGQTITSTIVGQVNDPTGAGVPEPR